MNRRWISLFLTSAFLLLPCALRAQSAQPLGARKYSQLLDVDLTGLADGNSTCWNVAANKWIPCSGGGGGGAVSSVFGRTGAVTAQSGDYTATQVGLGNVTNDAQTKAAIVPNTAPSAGQMLVGNAGGTAYAKQTLSGSGATASLSSAGVLTLSAIPNTTLSNSAIIIAGTSVPLGSSVSLDTISGVSANGFLKRTAANTWTNDNSTYLTGNQTITLSGDVTGSGATAITTALGNIPDLTTQAGSILITNIAAPTTPASAKTKLYVDSTSKNIAAKNDAGTVNHGIQTRTATASNWIRSVADDGSTTISQPTNSDVGLGNVTNDAQIKASDFPSSSVDSEIALFNGTTGKSLKRASTTGVLKASSGVIAAAAAGTDYVASVANPGSQLLGLTAINGSASTAMRSDGAPALDQSIAPTWTGSHIWKTTDTATNTVVYPVVVNHDSSGTPIQLFGSGIIFEGKDSTTSDQNIGIISGQWNVATHGSSRLGVLALLATTGSTGTNNGLYVYGSGGVATGSGSSQPVDPGNGRIHAKNGFYYNNSGGNSGQILQSDGTAYIASNYTLPTSVSTSGKVLQSDGTNIVTSTATWPTGSATTGHYPRGNGSNWVDSAIVATDISPTLPTVISVGTEFHSTAVPTATLPGTHAANDILLLLLQSDNDSQVAAPSGYTQLGPENGVGTNAAAGATKLSIFWKRDGGSESAPTLVDTGDHTYGVMIAVRGCPTAGDPFHLLGQNWLFTASTTETSPKGTTVVDNCLILDIFAHALDSAGAQSSGEANTDLTSVTEQFDGSTTDGNGGGIVVISGTKAKSGEIKATTTTIASSVNVSQRIAFLPSDTSQITNSPRPTQVEVFIGSPADLDDTWTKPFGAKQVFAQLCDGGGGGSSGNTATTAAGGGGGGGGGYDEATFQASDLGATITVHAGKGGAATSALNQVGNAGVLSQFDKSGTGPLTSLRRLTGTAATAAASADGGDGGCGSGSGVTALAAQATRVELNTGNNANSAFAKKGAVGGSGTTAPTGGSSADWGGGGGESGADTDAATTSVNNGWSLRGGGGGSSGRTNTTASIAGTGGGNDTAPATQGAAGTNSTRLPYGGSGGNGGGSTTAAGGAGGFPGGGGGGGGGVASGNGGAGGHGCVVVTTHF